MFLDHVPTDSYSHIEIFRNWE